MRLIFIILCLLSLYTCDDGDIINVQLEFDQVDLLKQTPDCKVLAYAVKGSKMEF